MTPYFLPIMVVLVIAVAASLFGGLVSMGVGGTFDDRNSERFMFARVGLQALAIGVVLLMVFFAR